jgi:hypothetical protein
MAENSHPFQPMFHIDVSTDASASKDGAAPDRDDLVISLLSKLVVGQDRQNKLLEELVQQTSAAQRQRASELGQWKEANPALARRCRAAAETLGRVQNEFLFNLTEEVNGNEECLMDGEFMMHEFVDRYGPRLAHLNGVLQVLSQLSVVPDTARTPK